MNRVILMGRLTREPEQRGAGNGPDSLTIARFTLAVDRRRTSENGQREADFISCTAFGKSAEFALRYLRTGTKIALTGRIQTGSYTNRDGQKVYTTDVIAEEIEFAESKYAQDLRQQGNPQDNYQREDRRQQYQERPQYMQQQYSQPQYSQPQQYQQAPVLNAQAPQMPAEDVPVMPAPVRKAEEAVQNEIPEAEDISGSGFLSSVEDENTVGEGFLNIPEGVEDEKLPFN